MDLSSEYIKMCDCPEIQGMYGIAYPDDDFMGKKNFYYDPIKGQSDYPGSPEVIWLPRQDQLQEMLYDNYKCFGIRIKNMLENFSKWAMQDKKFTSMEQLWLAFVMKDKFNKLYDGESFKDAKSS